MSKNINLQPYSHTIVRFAIMDYDSGLILGTIRDLPVDLFSKDNDIEAFCRLRDYLVWNLGMIVGDNQMREFITKRIEDELFGGECFLFDASWQGKTFGIIFQVK